MRRLPDILLVLTVILLIVSSQILAKTGAVSDNGGLLGIRMLNPLLALSYLFFLARGGLWAWVLRRNRVSRVYPFLSLAYPMVFAAGVIFFGDSVSIGKVVGTILILGGSVLLMGGTTSDSH